VVSALVVVLAFPFGARVTTGVPGFMLLILLISLWAMAYSGFLQFVAIKTRNAAATQSSGLVFFPLLFLTPNLVPRDLLTRPMEMAATFNPVTYIIEASRSLILEGYEWASIGRGFLVVAIAVVAMVTISIRAMNDYD
jgi:ABC-2 type transport system permease protein